MDKSIKKTALSPRIHDFRCGLISPVDFAGLGRFRPFNIYF